LAALFFAAHRFVCAALIFARASALKPALSRPGLGSPRRIVGEEVAGLLQSGNFGLNRENQLV
jgi:hypothetical protein